jgi:SH3 domain-containing YSC84-like protein 1
MRHAIPVLVFCAMGCSQPSRSAAEVRDGSRDRAAAELADAADVVREMNQIAPRHRERARCVAVVPSLVRAGFIVAGHHGDGVVSCRTPSGWSAPAFITVTGGGAGLQVGVESSDVVMLVMSDRAVTQLFQSNFSIGVDASASAGPVGEAAGAESDEKMRAEILSYARSRGLFAGAELSGAVVKRDTDAMVATYGASSDVHAILAGQVRAPKEAEAFLGSLGADFGPPQVTHAQ